MKTARRISAGLAGLALVLLAGCGMFEKSKPVPAVVGTWQNRIGTTWVIKEDGTFTVDLDQNGKPDAWGTYKVNGDTITLQATGGMKPKSCDGKGLYKFARNENELRFTLVSDACKLRKKNIQLPWRLKE